MSIKKNIVVGINDLNEERVIEVKTTDDGHVCVEPKADKIVISIDDIKNAVTLVEEFIIERDDSKKDGGSKKSTTHIVEDFSYMDE